MNPSNDRGADDVAGFELPLLLFGGFRSLIEALHIELAHDGHPEVRPVHGFALQAIGADGTTASELGRRLRVSKQAAGKTVRRLEELGYVRRVRDGADGRNRLVELTERGADVLARSARVFEKLHAQWEATLGRQRLRDIEDGLRQVAAPESFRLDTVGWLAP